VKQYSIVILPNAEQEIENAYLYIKKDSPINALNCYQEIYQKIQSLSSLPLRCTLAPENDFFEEEIRHLIVQNYRIIEPAHLHLENLQSGHLVRLSLKVINRP
jgi:plasmid stabilization system protein ParE